MTVSKAYTNNVSPRRMQLYLTVFLSLTTFFTVLAPAKIYAQDVPEYDEISIFIDVPLVGGTDIAAVIKGQELFLPITDLFDFLKIRNTSTPGLESVSGFFINPDAEFTISRTDNQIRYQDKTYKLQPGDLIRTESNLYLRASYFGKVFGLDCIFNFRSLSATIKSKLELPLIREMRQEEMRKNINRLKGDIKADTTIRRTYPLFRFGMADWSVIASEEINGKSDTRLNLGLGAMVAGGEANATLYYNSNEPFSEKQQYYQWRYVNNDFKALRQIRAGKISSNTISTIYNPIVGIQLTNTPTTYRRSFGTYTLSDKTEPGWVVELYVNNVLVDYKKADASGFFTFKVPLVYGNSIVRLKYFGPWGEERTREQNITIPFNFLPKKTMEYTVSAGIVEDTLGSRFSRASLHYGVSKNLTAGGGVEYLSSVTSGTVMPFLNASLRITNNLLLSGEYTNGVRSMGTVTYRLPSNIQLDLNYTWYNKDQKAISYNYREERKAVLSLPLHFGKMSSYQRFSLYQIVLPATKYLTGEWLFSSSFLGLSTSLTTYGLFLKNNDPYVYSNLSLAYRIPGGFILMPQAQYSYSKNEFISAKMAIEKHLFGHGFLNLSYEQIFSGNIRMAEAGFRYDFSFAQTGTSIRQTDRKTTLIQYARGSLLNDRKTKYMGTDNRTNVGKGGITILPFIDLNNNGRRDSGEPKAYGLNLRANGGRVEKSDRDTTIRIIGLEPYTTCFIELDPNSFDNISWRIQKPTINVAVDPNILKLVEVPIMAVGEATGVVNIEEEGQIRGLGRIIVNFLNSKLKSSGRVLSEEDGYFSYFGLAPGKYSVLVDTTQLKKLNMTAEPAIRSFEVNGGSEGDIINGLNFTLKAKPDTTVKHIPEAVKPAIKKDTAVLIVHEVTQELVTISEDSYAIQLGAFKVKSNADGMRRNLEKILKRKVEIIIENGFYKVRINEIKDREEVDKLISILHENGVNELWVISLKAKKQQWVVRETHDTVTTITERQQIPLNPKIVVQLGAFKQENNALDLKKHAAATILDRQVVIVKEGGYYKVRLTGVPIIKQDVLEEMKKLEPEIGKLGLKDIWVVPARLQVQSPSTIVEPVVPINPVRWDKEVPAVYKGRISNDLVRGDTTVIASLAGPTYSLQVGVYHKKSEALRAQRKIISKLDLPVEVVKVWDYYHVLVSGFYTREETFQYYPELAGLGFTRIILIERK